MTEQADYLYDVFISHSQTDKEWVWDELLSRLENAGLKVILDERDFEPGAPLVKEKERAVLQSRKTLLVLSPAYVAGDWTEFESVLVQTLDPAARKRRLIPVVRVPCRLDLRIRPLVAVDLTAGSEVQWQRLLRALDPNQPPAANPIQNLALAITESAAPTAAPGWHPLGSAWLAAGLIGVVLLVGLVNLLLSEWPILQNTASIMAGVAVLLFGWLGLREDRDFFQRLSYFLGKVHPAQAVMAIVLVAGLTLWGGVGWPRLQAIIAGPLGPRQPGVQRFAVGEWKNLTPGRSSLEGIWTEGTRRALYEKLSLVKTLQGIAVESPQVTDVVRRDLDLWIDGDFSKIGSIKLSASIAGRAGRYLRSVAVQREVDEGSTEVESQILALQNELAQTILSALDIQIQPALAEAIHNTPTGSAEALQLNNQAALLVMQGDLPGAEPLLRRALALDPAYADAHNNLGRLLQLRGDLPGAVAEYRQAIDLLPRIPLYHFNLGLAFDLGQDLPAAIHAYEQAIALDPTYVKALNNLGFVYLESGRLDQAFELFQRGLRLNPDASYLHKNLGRVYLEQRQPSEAIVELQRAIELSDVPYAEALFYLAVAYRDTGQTADACAALSSYAEVAPDDARDEPGRPIAAKNLASELQCP
ncbi:MAG: tetratricopeptide repeat protein [Anaerolineae bacterium]